MKKIVILGAGQFGQIAAEIAKEKYSSVVFLDDYSSMAVGKLSEFIRYKKSDFIIAIGNPNVREALFENIKKAGLKLTTLVSKHAFVSSNATVSEGCIVEPMSVVNSFAHLGRCCIINAGAIVNHNSSVGDYSQIDCNAVVSANSDIPPKTHLCFDGLSK